MRDLHDTLTRGGFRDDTHRAAVEAAAVDLAKRPALREDAMRARLGPKLTDLLDQTAEVILSAQGRVANVRHVPRGQSAEPAGGGSAPDARATRVEAEDGRVRASGAVGAGGPMGVRGLPYWDIFDRTAAMAIDMVDAIYETARWTLASAGPLRLASTEPWAESDQAYRSRLADYLGCDVTYSGSMLDDYGVEAAELPRARLVPASTMQGGADG